MCGVGWCSAGLIVIPNLLMAVLSPYIEFMEFLGQRGPSVPLSFPGFISNMTIQRQFFPNDEDQTGAAKALLRLQDTYNLDTDTLSRGNLPGKSH